MPSRRCACAREKVEIKPAEHMVSGETVYEVWIDGNMVAAIYPRPNGIRLLSRHVRADRKWTFQTGEAADVEAWDWEFKAAANMKRIMKQGGEADENR